MSELEEIRARWSRCRDLLLERRVFLYKRAEPLIRRLVIEDVETLLGQVEYLQTTLTRMEVPDADDPPDDPDEIRVDPDPLP